MSATVVTCDRGKDSDPTFEPDVTCIDPSETNITMAGGAFYVEKQLAGTSFVPSTYHTSQQLQQYVVSERINLYSNRYNEYITSLEENINTFKDNFFSSAQRETVTAVQFKTGSPDTSISSYDFSFFYDEEFQAAASQTS